MVAPNLAQVCTEVNAQCPVESSIYGYYPSLPVNAFFLAWFVVLLVANLGLGIRYKTWTYLIALGLGCLSEVIGTWLRILLVFIIRHRLQYRRIFSCSPFGKMINKKKTD